MRNLLSAAALFLLPALALAAPPRPLSPPLSRSEQFTVTSKVEVPGKTLKPGTYTISVVDNLSDRLVLRVTNQHGSTEATFLGLYSDALVNEDTTGPIAWSNTEGDRALRGFTFPGARSVEFVYPKEEAVEIAKHNADKVLAIDPGSDNLGQRSDHLSPDALQVVTLWMLTSTRVGPNAEPAIAAARYHASSQVSPVPASASAVPLPPGATAPTQMASAARKPLIAALPHTADDIATPLTISLLAFFTAAMLWFRRRSLNRFEQAHAPGK
jgi:hypothetical protein